MARKSRSSSDSSRSLSPYNKRNRPPRRSRSTDRRRSNRGRRSPPRRSRSRSWRRDAHSSTRRRSPRRFSRRSPSPRGRHRSRSRPRKSPNRKSRSPASKPKQQDKKPSSTENRRRSVSPKTRFVEKPTSRERPREVKDTAPKVREVESTAARYSRPAGRGEDQQSGNRPRSGSANRTHVGGAHSHPSPERKDVARTPAAVHSHREHARSRSPISHSDHPSTRTQSADGRPQGFGPRRDPPPPRDRRGSYGATSEKNTEKPELSRYRPVRDAGERQPIRNASPPHRGQGVIRQTSTTLHDRFSVAQGMSIHSTFDPPEQITIGIERNIPGNEPAVMRSEFRPEDVTVIRRKDEGVCPFYERQEFETRQEDEEYSERRVVKIVRPVEVQRGARGGGKFEQEYQMKNFEVQSGGHKMEADSCTSERVTLSDRWGTGKRDPEVLCSHAIENVIHHRRDLTETERLPNFRTSGITRDERTLHSGRSSGEFGEWDRYQRDPHDLRHNLVVKRRTGAPDSVESRCTVRYRFGRGDDADAHRPREGIQQGRRGSAIGVKPRLTSLVGHAEVGARSMDTRNVLPDFSKRENKYDYQAWEDHPEMIPRGSSYFEHDNRDDFNYRGRRGFGRGPFRGGGRGRGAGRRDFISSEPAWKHDKYEEIEDEDDNKPTSTT